MSQFQKNEIVWGKMPKGIPWPCLILESDNQAPTTSYWVYFFGTYNYARLPNSRLANFEENREKNINGYCQRLLPRSYHSFPEAVDEAELHLAKMKSNPLYQIPIHEFKGNKRKRPPIAQNNNKKFKPDIVLKELTVNITRLNGLNEKVQEPSKTVLNTDEIIVSKLKFGIVGIGILGSRVAKNLSQSGHLINIWNRTTSKCNKLMKQLEARYRNQVTTFLCPRILLENSDVILVCVSDQDVANSIFKNNFGINHPTDAILKNKGIVQMTTTGPEASKDFQAIIEKKGGKYLEAQIQGSKFDDNFIIITAGEKTLFFDCQSCFKAIGISAMYLGEVGYASKVNLIFQLIKGVHLAAFAEAFSFAERCGLKQELLKRIIEFMDMVSPYLSSKLKIIMNRDFDNVEQALKHLQADLKLGLDLSNSEGEPLFLASITNEIFKHCKRLEFENKDSASIYMRTKY
ncbi:unnamed protein product [Phyllotreta striolata]|uniref:Cytokine-like nuclear factor N-PAC n=1 Tax=Phyllotreta striolata TaxID=444603 RepID=A0A9N9XV27_PHYSR|nr:unnamed protein product [Phyllotreta striolata]